MTRSLREEIQAEAVWVGRLARRLAADDPDAADVAQDALAAAWDKAPARRDSLRPWLGKVVRDGVAMMRRGRGRRRARETAIAAAAADSAPGADAALAQVRLHQALVAAVLALEEPFRRTILARFVVGQRAVDLARAEGVPAGTIRWRQAEGLRRLRRALDAHAPRKQWMAIALSPAAGRRAGQAWLGSGVAIGAVVAVVVVVALVGVAGSRGGAPAAASVRPARPPSVAWRKALDDAAAAFGSFLSPAQPGTAAVTGVVVDDRGVAIAGARVEISPAVGLPGREPEAAAPTDAEGRFQFVPRRDERYAVGAVAAGHGPGLAVFDARAGRGAQPAIVVRLPSCEHRVDGRVVDAGGGAIAAAQVRAQPARMVGRYGPPVTADRDGRFSVCLGTGRAWLMIGADGYERVWREVTVFGVQRLLVELSPESVLRGRVVDARSGAPIGGAAVTAWPMERRAGEAAERGAVSDHDGTFAIDGLAAGRFQVQARAAGWTSVFKDDVLIAPLATATLDVEMPAATSARGVVSADGAPVAGVDVWLEARGGVAPVYSSVAVTRPDGSFQLSRVPMSAALVVHVGDARVVSPRVVDASSGVLSIQVEVAPLAGLEGEVVRDGVAVPGAEVVVIGPAGRRTQTADAQGRFRVGGLLDGPYQVFAAGAGAFTASPVVVDVPTMAAGVSVELDGGARVFGRVIDQRGEPVVGVTVEVTAQDSDDRGDCTTAIDGRFAIDALAGGRYRVRVSPFAGAQAPLAWFGDPAGSLDLDGGRAVVGPLTLRVARADAAVAGVVIDERGAPVADAVVRLGPVWGSGNGISTRTTVDGRFTLPTHGAGPFVVDAGRGAGPQAVSREVAPGQVDLILRLTRPGAVRGTVTGAITQVWIAREGGVDAAAVASSVLRTAPVDGAFRIDGVAPGAWLVTASDERGPVATARLDVRAGQATTVALAARATRPLAGRVVAMGTDQPVADMACVAAPAVGGARPPGLRPSLDADARSAADGRFVIPAAPVGDAVVVCRAAAGWSEGAAVVESGGTATIVVAPLPQRASATGCQLRQDRVHAEIEALGPGMQATRLSSGDRIVAVDGIAVEHVGSAAVHFWLAGRPIGRPVTVTVARGDERVAGAITPSGGD
ncbi:MAG: carboxypeptidase regulatory-like domain-containing protein [Kofleriaceae bacterium]